MVAKRFFCVSAGLLLLLTSDAPARVQQPELDSGVISPGEVFQHTFNAAGLYPYHCAFHPNMQGSVIVSVVGTPSVSVSIVNTAFGFNPSSVTVLPGGTVQWRNEDQVPHTVTSDVSTPATRKTWGGLKMRYRN